LGVNYEKIEGLVVGDGCIYEFKNQTLLEFVEEIFEKHEQKIYDLYLESDCENYFDSLLYAFPKEIEEIIDSLKEDLEEKSERLEETSFHVRVLTRSFLRFWKVFLEMMKNNMI